VCFNPGGLHLEAGVTHNSEAPAPSLLVAGGAFDGQGLAIGGKSGERRIGSGPSCHLRLELPNVSPVHAILRWDEHGVSIQDLGSTHGTFVNGEQIETPADLGDGDRVFLGIPGAPDSARLVLSLPDQPGRFPAPPVPYVEEDSDTDVTVEPILDGEPQPTASAPAPPAAKTRPAAGAREEYSEQPEIVGAERERHVSVPARPAAPPLRIRPAARQPSALRLLLVAAGALLLGAGAFVVLHRMQPKPPVLLTLSPPKAEPGQTVLLMGSSFEPSAEGNVVTFGDLPAEVASASATELSVVVPPGLPAGDEKGQHPVRVKARQLTSNALFFRAYLGPRVSAFEPDVAMPGDEVRAIGENFNETTKVAVGGEVAPVLSVEPSSLRFRVPNIAVPQGQIASVQVQVGRNSARLASLIIGRLPLVLEIVPPRGQPGERVTIKGRGFTAGAARVRFEPAWSGAGEAPILALSPHEMSVLVPGAGSLSASADATLSVRVADVGTSPPVPFSVPRPSASVFMPRFFGEVVAGSEGRRLLVATELGPLLLLSAADPRALAQRAAGVIASLNSLMEGGPGRSVGFEAREKPEPAVVAGGQAVPVVVATEADAAGYAEPIPPYEAAPAAAPTPRAVARYWAALLHDYFALFVQRQRPNRVVEITPRGRALLDLFADAERRGEGAGVPPAMVAALSPAQRLALAGMALRIPGEGAGSSGAAVAGRWDGTMEEAGQPQRRVQVRLKPEGAGISGSFTTQWGGVAMEIPLEGATYKAGALGFRVSLGGKPRQFAGTVEGRAIAGTIDGTGRFALRWVE
jgi:hypothetical protein